MTDEISIMLSCEVGMRTPDNPYLFRDTLKKLLMAGNLEYKNLIA